MSFKIREEHISTLANFMEDNIEFARGRLSSANSRDQFRKLWLDLTNRLNSLGYGGRTVEKWQRVRNKNCYFRLAIIH